MNCVCLQNNYAIVIKLDLFFIEGSLFQKFVEKICQKRVKM